MPYVTSRISAAAMLWSSRLCSAMDIYQAVRRLQSEMLHDVLGVLKNASKEIMRRCTLLWLKLLHRTDIEGSMEYLPVRTPVASSELSLTHTEDGYEPTFTCDRERVLRLVLAIVLSSTIFHKSWWTVYWSVSAIESNRWKHSPRLKSHPISSVSIGNRGLSQSE